MKKSVVAALQSTLAIGLVKCRIRYSHQFNKRLTVNINTPVESNNPQRTQKVDAGNLAATFGFGCTLQAFSVSFRNEHLSADDRLVA